MAQIPHADPGLVCPLHQQPVEEVCHMCPWWIAVRGQNANTGQDVDQWGCAIGFLPMLLINAAAETRGAAAATEDARNQIVDAFNQMADGVSRLAGGGQNSKVIEHARDRHQG